MGGTYHDMVRNWNVFDQQSNPASQKSITMIADGAEKQTSNHFRVEKGLESNIFHAVYVKRV